MDNFSLLLAHREIDGPYFRHIRQGLQQSKRIQINSSIKETIHSDRFFVNHLEKKKKLVGHNGCVNTIEWNSNGSLILTGSDDCKINIWSGPPHYKLIQTLKPGHQNNIFCAKFVPFTGDKKVISCGMDGHVRVTDITTSPNGTPILLFSHYMMALKLFPLPLDPQTFLGTHQDGNIRKYDLRTNTFTIHQTMRNSQDNISASSLAFSPLNPHRYVVAAGDTILREYDDRYDIDKPIKSYCPESIFSRSSHFSGVNISDVSWNCYNEIVFNYSHEDVYLFSAGEPSAKDMEKDVIVKQKQVFKGRKNEQTFLKEVDFFGNNNYIVTGGDCGNIFIWEKESAELVQLLKGDANVVNGVSPHPEDIPILACCGIDSDGKIFEVGEKMTFNAEKAKKILNENQNSFNYQRSINRFFRWLSSSPSSDDEGIEEEEEEETEDNMIVDENQSPSEELNMEENEIIQEEDDLDTQKKKLELSDQIRFDANNLFKEGKLKEAIDKSEEALHYLNFPSSHEEIKKEQEEKKIACQLNKAFFFLKLEEYDQVIETCSQILETRPETVKAFYRRGCAYVAKNQYEEAIQDLMKAHQLLPSDPLIKKALEEAQTKSKKMMMK